MEGRAHTKPQSSICLSLGAAVSRFLEAHPCDRKCRCLHLWQRYGRIPTRERSRSLKPCLFDRRISAEPQSGQQNCPEMVTRATPLPRFAL
jgi:hypothetical protein